MIVCNICKKKFTQQDIELKNKMASMDGEELETQYFQCPHCNKNYLIKIRNEEYAQKEFLYQKKIEIIQQRKLKGKSISESSIRKMTKMKEQLSYLQKQLKDKYLDCLPEYK